MLSRSTQGISLAPRLVHTVSNVICLPLSSNATSFALISDDRTGASIKGKIEAALEIQSILGSDKPNMLIIDEIDGVSSSGGEQSFIKLLVDIATVEVMSKEENTKSGGGNRKNKKFTKRPLMRPIICICNDQ